MRTERETENGKRTGRKRGGAGIGGLVGALALLLLAAVLRTGCGRPNLPEPRETETAEWEETMEASSGEGTRPPAETAPPEETGTTAPETERGGAGARVCRVGESFTDGTLEVFYTASGEGGADLPELPGDRKYIWLEILCVSQGETVSTGISLYDFTCTADGEAAPMYYGAGDTVSATLSPGRRSKGRMVFEVPKNAEEIRVTYDPSGFAEDVILLSWEGTRSADIPLTGTAPNADGAYAAGETAEADGMQVTMLRCETEESDSEWICPRDGYHFVTAEFSVQNRTEEERSITGGSFACYADGMNCEAEWFREDGIGAELLPGEETAGTVSFEVPDGAEWIEFEFRPGLLSSGRVVFRAEESGT